MVLGCQAGVGQVAVGVAPFTQSSVVEHLQLVGNDEGNDAALETLLEHDEASDTAVAVLKRMDALKTYMK